MITTYEALSIGQYQEIDRITRAGLDELETQVAVLSILTGKSEAQLLRLPLAEYTETAGKAAFLRKPLETVPAVRKEYRVGEFTLRPCQDYRKLTAGQYIDFQTFTRGELDFCGLLSVLLVPAGCKYGEGYDTAEVRNAIAGSLPMPDGMALIAFFLRRFAVLMQVSLTYCENALRHLKDKTKRRQMEQRIAQARTLLRLAGAGLRM